MCVKCRSILLLWISQKKVEMNLIHETPSYG
jgi:hypothetical protein